MQNKNKPPRLYEYWSDDREYSYADDLKNCAIRGFEHYYCWIRFLFTAEFDEYTKNEDNFYRFKYILHLCCILPFLIYFIYAAYFFIVYSDVVVDSINRTGFTLLTLYADLFFGRFLSPRHMRRAVFFFFFVSLF